ncbi:MAG TPA: gas vesicle protein [Actinomycetota bacterium]|nr:gas vesicle protein [Actinomycetota bacterium]
MQTERYSRAAPPVSGGGGDLADILERVLDKGIVVAGDIAINLLDIELLTIKLRLLIASADTAKKMGIDWWENDPFLSGNARESLPDGPASDVEARLERIETALTKLLPSEEDGQ